MKEKVYITRDELSDNVWIWQKADKNEVIPTKLKNCDVICWQRGGSTDSKYCSCYAIKDFKKKFGITIKKKEKLCIHLDKELLNNQDYRMFSMDSKRKK